MRYGLGVTMSKKVSRVRTSAWRDGGGRGARACHLPQLVEVDEQRRRPDRLEVLRPAPVWAQTGDQKPRLVAARHDRGSMVPREAPGLLKRRSGLCG